jgi:hypothetical protein
MNQPFFKRTVPMAAMLVIVFVLLILPHIDSMFFASARYTQCSDLVRSDPAKALDLAHAWRAEFPDSLLGKHCEAVALFATKDYARAGDAFLALAKLVTNTNSTLSARLFMQGSEAYMAAGKPDQAKEAQTAAMLVNPGLAQANTLPVEKAKENLAAPPAATPEKASK